MSFIIVKDPLIFSICLNITLWFLAFVDSTMTGNYSWVDRIWSIIPFVYCWIFAIGGYFGYGLFSLRTWVIAILTTIWGVRLTLNFVRKGGYEEGEQDYRWPIVRKVIKNNFLWHLFNLFFISIYQNVLLFLIAFPAYACLLDDVNLPWTEMDTFLTFAFICLFLGESIADNEQWDFQTEKYKLLAENGGDIKSLPAPYSVGFLTEGLFAYSRHPNYFCEISMWFCIYGFSANVQSVTVFGIENFPFWIGAVQLMLLFLGSTILTERISIAKYPAYKKYQKITSMWIPMLPNYPALRKLAN